MPLLAPTIALILPLLASAPPVTRTAGGVTVIADIVDAFPGGMIPVSVRSRRPIRGVVYGILDGRRCPAFWTLGGLRALVPIPVTHTPGPATLGVEIRTARGRQRIPIPIAIEDRAYPASSRVVP